jgi:steroid delta-isomerase-like uncharacterized protein
MANNDNTLTTIQQWIDAFNHEDWDRFTALMADDITFTQQTDGQTDRSAASVRATFEAWRTDWTDLHGEITNAFACGDRGAIEVIWTGTLQQGERIKFPACLVCTLHEGKIVQVRDYYDRHSRL